MSIEITLPNGTRLSVGSVAEAKELLNGAASGEAQHGATPPTAVQQAIAGMDRAMGARPPVLPKTRRGRTKEVVTNMEMAANVWAYHNAGKTQLEIAAIMDISKSSVQRILGTHGVLPKDATPALKIPVVEGGHSRSYLVSEVAAAVNKAGKKLSLRQIRRLPGVTRGSVTAIGGRLRRAVENGLVQRLRAGHYAPANYPVNDWEYTAMTKAEAIRNGLSLVKFMTEHPDITLRNDLIAAAIKGGIGSTPASVNVRLWAARASGMVEGHGYIRRNSPPLKVTDFGLNEAAKQDEKEK